MVTELKDILSKTKGEGEISTFLAKHPELIRWAVCRTGGHTTYVIKQFPLGSKYIADFVVAFSYSGAWEVHLIELEPPEDKVITKAGLPSNRLNKAISQLHEWEDYIKINRQSFRSDLAEWCIKKDLLGLDNDLETPVNFTNNRLNDPETCKWDYYHIFIGRRENINQEQRKRINQLSSHATEIKTYDRLIDLADKIEFSNDNPRVSVRIRESEEE